MTPPPGWQNPITAVPSQVQSGVDSNALLPSRQELDRFRLDCQRALLAAGIRRHTPIQVTPDGVIWDGHHAVRAAAEKGETVEVLVVPVRVPPAGPAILDLPVR